MHRQHTIPPQHRYSNSTTPSTHTRRHTAPCFVDAFLPCPQQLLPQQTHQRLCQHLQPPQLRGRQQVEVGQGLPSSHLQRQQQLLWQGPAQSTAAGGCPGGETGWRVSDVARTRYNLPTQNTVCWRTGLTSKPCFGSQAKYASPFTVPLFLPTGSSNTTPAITPEDAPTATTHAM